MEKDQKSILLLLAIFVVLLSTTLFVSFSSNTDVQEVIVKSITPVYDESSTVVVDSNNVVFNDKNQVVDYKVVIENTQNYDVKITDIVLSTPTEAFLQYTVEDISKDDVLAANSIKELTISLETMGIEGWGRNFADELTANVSFERVAKQEETPKKEEKEEDKQPEPPAPTIKEVIKQTEKIEPTKVTKDVIEFKEEVKVEVGDKIAVWIYSEPIFLGYFDVVETNGVKQIVGLEEALKKADIEVGEHNIVLETEDNEVLGYVEIYINEDKDLLSEKPQDTNKEELPKEEDKPVIENKPSTDNKDESEEDGKVENPYTSDKGLLVVLVIATGITGLAIIVVSKNKFAKYTIFIIALSSSLTLVNAEEPSDLPITINASFKSQNVMKPSGWDIDLETININKLGTDFWVFAMQIRNIYIQNEIAEIKEYVYQFDVTEDDNGRVMAYLVERDDGSVCYNVDGEYDVCYDLYLQADGVIYPNEDASFYFGLMLFLDSINNLEGMDTGNVTDMSFMFYSTGGSTDFTLDVSNFDTSNVTDVSYMFFSTGFNSESFTLDVSNFDTSNVTNMRNMFYYTGYNSENFTLDVSNFDTSNVTNMSGMFNYAGYSNPDFTLDVSNFDTSKVTDMSLMFAWTGYNSTKLNTSITISNPNTTSYSDMFYSVATNEGSQIIVNFTYETELLADKMIATQSDGSKVVKGICTDCEDGYIPIGIEVDINGEKFNVIRQTDDTVSMLAQYNLDTNYRQSMTNNDVIFANDGGWEYKPGPKEINIEEWSYNLKTYIYAYIEYLKEEINDDSVAGDLITLKELGALGCAVNDDYSYTSGHTCNNSLYKSWLINNQYWWTRSTPPSSNSSVWFVYNNGYLSGASIYAYIGGVRPVITISKQALKNLN